MDALPGPAAPTGFPAPTWRNVGWGRDGACPCGAGAPFARCCGPLLDDGRHAPSPEALMRSRFCATCLGDTDYLGRTWHPATRPELGPSGRLAAAGLQVEECSGFDPGREPVKGDRAQVAFRASLWPGDGTVTGLQERSEFEFRAGRWLYLDGEARWVEKP